MQLRSLFALVALLLLLAACSSKPSRPQPEPTPPEDKATLSGQLSFRSAGFSTEELLAARAGTPFIPGQLIVRRTEELLLDNQSMTLSGEAGRVGFVRNLAVPGERSALYVNSSLTPDETLALARQLSSEPGVDYAYPNYLLQPASNRTIRQAPVTPNDELYQHQWHYEAINLPQAWSITTGSPNTVIAVIDTGIVPHPDLTSNRLQGYDFISDPRMAGDGDGRDPDPFDEGNDIPLGNDQFASSYHGTHVAGTISAATNNQVGLAGVDWEAQLLPIRVLGVGGGSLIDILEATYWAAGGEVEGVPPNTTPAKIINLSLGGDGPCLPDQQFVIDYAVSRGSVVVVASGNEDEPTANKDPGNCNNVINVGATDYLGNRSPYSNYGPEIHIMAPGGDLTANNFDPQYPDGVLSLGFYDEAQEFTFTFMEGTSMSAPHVAGVIGLMVSVNPNLTHNEILQILTTTAKPLSDAQCRQPRGCGAGLIDAYAAVSAAAGGAGQPPTEPPPPPSQPPPPSEPPAPGEPSPPGEPAPPPSPTEPAPPPAGHPNGPTIVIAVQENPRTGELTVTGQADSAAFLQRYSMQVEPGETAVLAWMDVNQNFEIDAGDYVGVYPWPLNVQSGSSRDDVNILLDRVTGFAWNSPYAAPLKEQMLHLREP